jgi:murein DD-endopeptidase MepM/ murein hydrolase activator NlpD
MSNPVLGVLQAVAKKYNLDWKALAAVANAESGLNPGNVGDNGSSFGLFQLHQGGALGNMSTSQARQYLDANKNAEFAARQMHQMGMGGLRGKAAVQNMVSRFERPADPNSEISRALKYYNGLGGTGAMSMGSTAQSVAQSASGTQDKSKMFLNYLMSKNAGNPGSSNNLLSIMRTNPMTSGGDPSSPGAGSVNASGVAGLDAANASPAVAGKGGYDVPVAGAFKIIGIPYQGTHTNYGNWESDNAVDMSVKRGTPIYATADGTIGSQFGALDSKDPALLGLRLHLKTKGNEFYYAHLSKFAPGLKPGQSVKKGQLLGFSGTANGVDHLHIGVQNGDPMSYWGG